MLGSVVGAVVSGLATAGAFGIFGFVAGFAVPAAPDAVPAAEPTGAPVPGTFTVFFLEAAAPPATGAVPSGDDLAAGFAGVGAAAEGGNAAYFGSTTTWPGVNALAFGVLSGL